MSQSQSQSSLIHTLLNIYASKTAAHNLELLFYVVGLICQRKSSPFTLVPRRSASLSDPHLSAQSRVYLLAYVRGRTPVILITVNNAVLTLT